ncbi:flavin reductase [Erythrobacter arachoides]|uniref:Flavin reductase n=1 Tax=Aurantiacibacter arachoides TaxID=1850444 RepID=A0A845A6U6_9SPHN|nr:flavin reductase family protein [Aurantiacibacter arachoides]MXO93269.1 flavin reductase [Aurantiacibacter arachoides]GGD50659.1 FMN reductase [Aurantiacibacter arachoides]
MAADINTPDAIGFAFREAMRHVAATVYAVTTTHRGERFGILATSVASLSFDPPSLLACINREASLHDPLAEAERFCVNILGLANRDVAERFMRAGVEGRFAVGDWADEHGVPVLRSAQSSLVCSVADRHAFGTHTIFVGELIAASHRHDAKPLTYFDRHIVDITEAPESDGR